MVKKKRMRIFKDAKSIKGKPFPENKRDKDKTKRKKDG
jgi:hypothetical protein